VTNVQRWSKRDKRTKTGTKTNRDRDKERQMDRSRDRDKDRDNESQGQRVTETWAKRDRLGQRETDRNSGGVGGPRGELTRVKRQSPVPTSQNLMVLSREPEARKGPGCLFLDCATGNILIRQV